MAPFELVFPAIRGVQAGRQYFVAQLPLRVIPRLFRFDDPDLPPEVRAQRVLNRARVPEMAAYIVENQDSYVFSAITASVDADVTFEPLASENGSELGMLRLPMDARFVINDGQHRRAAIEEALEREPSVGNDTIGVVLFLDVGLERSQQMFADLNRHAIRPSMSLGVLYDHRDPYAEVAREVVVSSPLLRDVVEMEKSSLSPKSRKLITLSSVFQACRDLLPDLDADDVVESTAVASAFFSGIGSGFVEWQDVSKKKLTAGEVRQDYIHSHGVVLQALGRVGAAILSRDPKPDWDDVGRQLGKLDWRRSNREWEGRALIGGRVSRAGNNITLTVCAIKAHLGEPLTPEEQRVEDAHRRGAQQ